MTERAITKRVSALGDELGIRGLSAHDCRHYWATQAARSGTPVKNLQEAGGWNSPAFQELRAAHLRKDVSGTACAECAAA